MLVESCLEPLEEGNKGSEREGNMPCQFLNDRLGTCWDIDS